MAGKVINLDNILVKDEKACRIAQLWVNWNTGRQGWRSDVEELRKYLFATDTTKTTNSKLPWKNKTTVPKLCQIRDNLNANYMAAMFPKRKFLHWEANERDANSKAKRDAILNYMTWVTSQNRYKTEMAKLVLDYIDYGNAFGTVEWVDERQPTEANAGGVQPVRAGYIGPAVRRISPLDIVFDPTATSFQDSPKIVRSLLSIGEIKKMIESEGQEDREELTKIYNYLVETRSTARSEVGTEFQTKDNFLMVDGFTSYRHYMESDYVEILTFYGDIFDWEKKELTVNRKIMIVDRHKIFSDKPNPAAFGYAPIFHVGWRIRQDNLWAMGPMFNLVGLQYRLDHVENLKADVFDLNTFPPLKVKGYVQDFTWGPMERIYVGEEGDVEMIAPPFQILQANVEIQYLMQLMEEMSGSPKEAMGFRTPGEKTAFEVQRLENAGSRIFINKIIQCEEFTESLQNAMLELAQRNLSATQLISVFDDELKFQAFTTLTPQDIVGSGRIKPVAARHFAEKAEMIQNLTNFYASGPGQDPEVRMHLSGIATARLFEDLLHLGDWKIVQDYVRLSEQQEAQRIMQSGQEQLEMEIMTPAGLTPDDYDPEAGEMPMEMPGAAPE